MAEPLDGVRRRVRVALRVAAAVAKDLQRGEYDHGGRGAFDLKVATRTIGGSGRPIVEVVNVSSDTFRFEDGAIPLDEAMRVMTVDGKQDADVHVWLSITDGSGAVFTTDLLPGAFPFLEIKSYPHTFSVKDGGGTLLLQLSEMRQP